MLKLIIDLLNRLAWVLPSSVHECILARTGWRLVKVNNPDTEETTFEWTKKYPLEVEGIKESCTL
jgi:hypothetical protein